LNLPAPPDPVGTRKILVRSTNWIGDVVMISPALAALRRRFASARIEVIVLPHLAECFDGNPAVDEVIPFDRRGRDSGAAGLLRFSRSLRARGYDAAVLFQKAIGAALMARIAGIPVRIGIAADARGWLLTHPIRLTGEIAGRHHLDLFLEVARAAGCDTGDRTTFFPIGSEATAFAASFLEETGAARFPSLIALHVGASKRPRAWHLDRFIEAARRIAREHDAGVLLVGGAGDREAMDRVAGSLGDLAINACGRTSIRQMAALIARCRLLLGNDSGPMHLAAALGVPVAAVFGPGDPARTAPVFVPRNGGARESVAAISRRYPCAPCRQDFFRECYPSPSGKPMCLESIGVDEVVAAASRLLGR
jgi:lipopolysaccharide heptosyltransferase II